MEPDRAAARQRGTGELRPGITFARLAGAGLILAVFGRPAAQGPAAAAPPGVVRAGEYRPASAGGGAGPVGTAGGSVYDVGPFPLVTPELAPGEGRDLTTAMCSVCHSVRYITMQPSLSRETWQAIVRKMIDVHGAPIPEDVAAQITRYLQMHYAPGK